MGTATRATAAPGPASVISDGMGLCVPTVISAFMEPNAQFVQTVTKALAILVWMETGCVNANLVGMVSCVTVALPVFTVCLVLPVMIVVTTDRATTVLLATVSVTATLVLRATSAKPVPRVTMARPVTLACSIAHVETAMMDSVALDSAIAKATLMEMIVVSVLMISTDLYAQHALIAASAVIVTLATLEAVNVIATWVGRDRHARSVIAITGEAAVQMNARIAA